MKIDYPWLLDPWYENENIKFSKREFLKSIDDILNQRQYVKITLLNWKEQPIKSIEGEIVSGTLTKDGSSAVRRTCNLTCNVSGEAYDINDMKMDYSINKKIFLEIGIKNETEKYQEHPILWFPQGVFFISSFAMNSASTSTIGLSIGLKDKMAMLDGTIGGKFPTTVILDEEDTQTASGEIVTRKVKIYDIIMEVVNHFGGEDLTNIVVADVPSKIGRIVRWMNSEQPIYLSKKTDTDGNITYSISLEKPNNTEEYRTCEYGDDIGYIYEDFVYDSELTVAAGSTITAALDTIKNYLGNFEYFYDEFGVFHFQEIKNYLNNSQSIYSIRDMNEYNYLMDTISLGKDVYSFDGDRNLISISITPQYENIKNDFIVHGTRKASNSNVSYDVMYHLAIDKKPDINSEGYSNILIYKDKKTKLETLCIPEIVFEGNTLSTDFDDDPDSSLKHLPDFGEANTIYGIINEPRWLKFEVPQTLNDIKEQDVDGETYLQLDERKTIENVETNSSLTEETLNIQWKKSLLNALTLLTEYKIDNSIDSARLNLEEEITKQFQNVVNVLSLYDTFPDNTIKIQKDNILDIAIATQNKIYYRCYTDYEEDNENSEENNALQTDESEIDSNENKSEINKKEYNSDEDVYNKIAEIFSEIEVNNKLLSTDKATSNKQKEILEKINSLELEEALNPKMIASYQNILESKEKNKPTKEQIDIKEGLKTEACKTYAKKQQLAINFIVDKTKPESENGDDILYPANCWKIINERELIRDNDKLEAMSGEALDEYVKWQERIINAIETNEKDIKEMNKENTKLNFEAYKNKFKESDNEKINYHQELEKLNRMQSTLDEIENLKKYIQTLKDEEKTLQERINWWKSRLNLQIKTEMENASSKDFSESEWPKKTCLFKVLETSFWYWDNAWKKIDWIKYYHQANNGNETTNVYKYIDFKYDELNNWYDKNEKIISNISENQREERTYIAKDWRTEIILQGLQSIRYATDKNSYYFEELIANWPTVYNLNTQEFRGLEAEKSKQYKSLCDGNYFLDFIDSSSNIYGEFCVDNIGRRQNITVSNDINCLFEPDTWPIGFIIPEMLLKKATTQEEYDNLREELLQTLESEGMEPMQVSNELTEHFRTGGIANGAFPQIKYDLLTHTMYQKSLMLSAIPAWYLEPNVLISINDKSTNTFGNYMMQSISYTLGPGNPMSVTCVETIQKI